MMFLRWRIWVVYAVLFGLAVPWYWRFIPLGHGRLWFGMPSWATASIVASLFISLYTAWLLRRRWPDEEASSGGAP
jgi:hypothetical protein